jgi:mono/diheme cytochrome c family protein
MTGLTARSSLALLLLCVSAQPGHALDREQQRIKGVLTELCGQCHAVATTGKSPHPLAPAFRTFGDSKLYDENFGERLQDGLSSIHPDMPSFHFDRRDAEAAVSYLRAIQQRKR